MKYRIFKCIDIKSFEKTKPYDNVVGLEKGMVLIGKTYNHKYYSPIETIDFYGKMSTYLLSNFEELNIEELIIPDYSTINYNNKSYLLIEIIKLVNKHPESVNVIRKNIHYFNDNDYITCVMYSTIPDLIKLIDKIKSEIIENEISCKFNEIMQ
jgi:hypothetical protein